MCVNSINVIGKGKIKVWGYSKEERIVISIIFWVWNGDGGGGYGKDRFLGFWIGR